MGGSEEKMNEIEDLSKKLQAYIFELVEPIQATKKINHEAFNRADEVGRELTRLLKGQELLPRSALYSLDMAVGVLLNEAEYCRDKEEVLAVAKGLRLTYGLLLCGEAHDE